MVQYSLRNRGWGLFDPCPVTNYSMNQTWGKYFCIFCLLVFSQGLGNDWLWQALTKYLLNTTCVDIQNVQFYFSMSSVREKQFQLLKIYIQGTFSPHPPPENDVNKIQAIDDTNHVINHLATVLDMILIPLKINFKISHINIFFITFKVLSCFITWSSIFCFFIFQMLM